MEQKEIIEGNQLIADFLGVGWHDNGTVSRHPSVLPFRMGTDKIEDVKFHSSWDWAMLVLREIKHGNPYTKKTYVVWNTLSDESRKRYMAIQNELCNLNLGNVWFCIVKFIQWYNSKK